MEKHTHLSAHQLVLALRFQTREAEEERERVRVFAGNEDEKVSLLLASGWWGMARHMHYVPEIMASVLWTLPAQFNRALPWLYVIYLTLLLLDRLFRDHARCKAKYGKYWDEYCAQVPYMIIPYVL
jgi:7-dehydrocholesterol reductase